MAQQKSTLKLNSNLIIDTVPDGLMVVDAHCCIVRWNKAMSELTGYTEDAAIGQRTQMLNFRDTATGEKLNSEQACLNLKKGVFPDVKVMFCNLHRPDGQVIPVEKLGRMIQDADGNIIGILVIVRDQRQIHQLEDEIRSLKQSQAGAPPGRLIGNSTAMQTVYERIRLAAMSEATVLIQGETGTGKELVAKAIHAESTRHVAPIVAVNCSALSENLLENELFGHVKGAFTGAIADKVGRLEMASGGTLFLDEIGDVSPLIQLKLLRVLQEREYERVGDSTAQKTDARIIAATHRNLKERTASGAFREDFYYRINVFNIMLPPLRERKDDIPLLVASFISKLNVQTGKSIKGVSRDALSIFNDYCWPGNVRELENAIEHAFVTCQEDMIEPYHLPLDIQSTQQRQFDCAGKSKGGQPVSMVQPLTKELIETTLSESGGNRSEAARRLGVDRSTLWRNMKRLGIVAE